jgi:hypothetical protein
VTYRTIQPPFTLEFHKMPKDELRAYYRWFLDQIQERIPELEKAVSETSEYERWRADVTPSSLDDLGEWFAGQVETRPRTPEELAELKRESPYPIDLEPDELTNRTFSLAMDIGMYLSQVLMKNLPVLRWEHPLGSPKFVDYGQPVLRGSGRVPLNPVGLMVTLAYGIARKTKSGQRLRELYNIWFDKLVAAE